MKTVVRNFISVLRRFKMATLLNILGLSIAFAAFMVIMMQLDYDWNFARMHKHSDRIYRLEMLLEKGGQVVLPRPMVEKFAQSSPHILAGTACGFWGKNVFSVETHGAKNSFEEELIVARPEFTDVFEFDILYGTDKALTDPDKVLISESLSKKFYGNEPAIGKIIYLDTAALTVGGVYKDFPLNALLKNAVYMPIRMEQDLNEWRNWGYHCYIRVDAPENSTSLIENFKKNFDPALLADGFQWVVDTDYRLTALTDIHFCNDVSYDSSIPKSNRQTLPILFAIALVIIIVAAINFTNFSTALSPIRIKSINTQKILGGSERFIRFSLIMEAVSICVASFLIAILFVVLLSDTPVRNLLQADPSLSAHPFIVGGTLLLALLTGFIAGLYPAYYVTSVSPAIVLKGSFGLSPKGRKLRNALIGVQYLASFTLIIGAFCMYLQNKYMQNSELGYDKERLIVSDINPTIEKNIDAFTNQLKSLAEVEDVSYSHALISSQDQYWGRNVAFHDKKLSYQCLVVEPSFVRLMGIPVLDGRDFLQEDKQKEGGALIFNERARDEYQLKIGDNVAGSEIVGFAPDIKFASFRTEVVPMAFLVGGNREPEYAYIKIKKGADMQKVKNQIHQVMDTFDKGYPFHIQFFDNIFEDTYEVERKLGSLVLLFSLIAILISVVGVFGLVIFESESRRKEIGVRKVLGSTTHQIILLFNKTYIRILCVCFVIAAPIAYYVIIRWLENFAYKTPIYWWIFAMAFALVTVITIFTVTFQNWRVANANPVNSIKVE